MAKAASRSRIKGQIDITTLMCFTFGVVFVCVMLGFANFNPNPTPFQFRIFLTVLALAAAGVGAALPGYLEVQKPGVFRAGGALALFVLVITNQSVLKKEVVSYEEPSEDPRRVAESFVTLNDTGKIALAWSLLDPATRKLSFLSEEYYQTMYRNFRKPLGEVSWRREVGTGGAQSPAGLPVGLYKHFYYRTKFANDRQCRYEVVTLRATEDVTWRVATYQIEPQDSDCGSQRRPGPPTSL